MSPLFSVTDIWLFKMYTMSARYRKLIYMKMTNGVALTNKESFRFIHLFSFSLIQTYQELDIYKPLFGWRRGRESLPESLVEEVVTLVPGAAQLSPTCRTALPVTMLDEDPNTPAAHATKRNRLIIKAVWENEALRRKGEKNQANVHWWKPRTRRKYWFTWKDHNKTKNEWKKKLTAKPDLITFHNVLYTENKRKTTVAIRSDKKTVMILPHL